MATSSVIGSLGGEVRRWLATLHQLKAFLAAWAKVRSVLSA